MTLTMTYRMAPLSLSAEQQGLVDEIDEMLGGMTPAERHNVEKHVLRGDGEDPQKLALMIVRHREWLNR